MNWDDVRVFLAVARLGSHKRAARELEVDPTTVGRRMLALERTLGARLLARTPERVQLTTAGRRLLPHAEGMEADALAAGRELAAADAELAGALRVTAPDGLVHYVLVPALASLRREHPRLVVEFRAEARVLDLSRREADVAVRLLRPKEPALVAQKLGTLRFSFFASDAYLERHGTPRSTAALAAHDFVGFDPAFDALPQGRWLERAVPKPRYAVRASTTTAQLLACAEGYGIALLPVYAGTRVPGLQRLLPRLVGPAREMWGITHVDLRGNARVGACLTWLASALAEAPAG